MNSEFTKEELERFAKAREQEKNRALKYQWGEYTLLIDPVTKQSFEDFHKESFDDVLQNFLSNASDFSTLEEKIECLVKIAKDKDFIHIDMSKPDETISSITEDYFATILDKDLINNPEVLYRLGLDDEDIERFKETVENEYGDF